MEGIIWQLSFSTETVFVYAYLTYICVCVVCMHVFVHSWVCARGYVKAEREKERETIWTIVLWTQALLNPLNWHWQLPYKIYRVLSPYLATTSAYICCAHSGTSTRSLRSLRLCARILSRFAPSGLVLRICILGCFAPSGFVLCTCINARTMRSHASLSNAPPSSLKRKKNCPCWESNLQVESTLDLKSIALLNHSATGEDLQVVEG